MTRETPEGRSRLPETSDPSFYEAFGRAVKVVRTEIGLSRKELAMRARVSYPYLADIESGRGRPSSTAILAIAQALGMSPSSLIARAEQLAARMGEPVTPTPSAAPMPPPSRSVPARRWFHDEPPVAADASPPAEAEPTVILSREELHRLIDRLPDEDVPFALELTRRLVRELPPDR